MADESQGNKRRRDAEGTRRKIMAAAQSIFATNGFSATSMSDIARGAEVTKSLIHHHFGSKADLWRRVLEDALSALRAQQLATFARHHDTCDDFVEQGFAAYFEFLMENQEFLQMAWWSEAERGGHGDKTAVGTGRTIKGLMEVGVKKIVELQKQQQIRSDLDPEVIFVAGLGIIRHWFNVRRDIGVAGDASGFADRAYLRSIIRIFLDGIRDRSDSEEK